jgi:50S ribosomal subunit-associated GTPase HflX
MIEVNKKYTEKAVLVGLVTPGQNRQKVEEYLNELAFLLETAGGVEIQRFVQSLRRCLPLELPQDRVVGHDHRR